MPVNLAYLCSLSHTPHQSPSMSLLVRDCGNHKLLARICQPIQHLTLCCTGSPVKMSQAPSSVFTPEWNRRNDADLYFSHAFAHWPTLLMCPSSTPSPTDRNPSIASQAGMCVFDEHSAHGLVSRRKVIKTHLQCIILGFKHPSDCITSLWLPTFAGFLPSVRTCEGVGFW